MRVPYKCQIKHHYFHFSFYSFGKSLPVRMKLGLLLLGLGGNLFFSQIWGIWFGWISVHLMQKGWKHLTLRPFSELSSNQLCLKMPNLESSCSALFWKIFQKEKNPSPSFLNSICPTCHSQSIFSNDSLLLVGMVFLPFRLNDRYWNLLKWYLKSSLQKHHPIIQCPIQSQGALALHLIQDCGNQCWDLFQLHSAAGTREMRHKRSWI